MPFVQITWLPKACRTAAVRKEIVDAVMKVRDTGWLVKFHNVAVDKIIQSVLWALSSLF